ncbi:MAG: hypothetical protein ABIT37_07415 [Luteolibacter sp.]
MPDYIPPACDRCGAADAPNRLFYATLGISENLCDGCHSQRHWPFAESAEGVRKVGTCQYCGGMPSCGGTDTFEMMLGGGQKFWQMCSSCFTEHHKVYFEKLTEELVGSKIDVPENHGLETSLEEAKLNALLAKLVEFSKMLSPEQQIATIKKVKTEIENHMSRFVAERNL